MNICIISTTIMPCPPPGYAGLEMLAYQQAEGLARRGHHVLLVAPGESRPPPGVIIHRTTIGEEEGKAYSCYWQRLLNYDAVIDNSWMKFSYLVKSEGRLKAPVLGVLHAPVHTMYATPPPVEKPCLVAISKDQAIAVAEFLGRDAKVCYNGIDPEFYQNRANRKRNGRYLFLSRMSTIKGPDIAVELAQKLRFGLDLVGDDTITTEPEYRDKLKAASVNGISYVGPQTREQCVGWFTANKALLHMNIRFREPFGLSPVEAQACFPAETSVRAAGVNKVYESSFTGRLIQVSCGDKLIECTPEHPFLTQRGWVPAKELTTADLLVKRCGDEGDVGAERIGDFTKRISETWAVQNGGAIRPRGFTGGQQGQEAEVDQSHLSSLDTAGRTGVEVGLSDGRDGRRARGAAEPYGQTDTGSCSKAEAPLRKSGRPFYAERTCDYEGLIFSFGSKQDGQFVTSASGRVDQAQSNIFAVVQNLERQVEAASGYVDQGGFSLHGRIRRWGRHRFPQAATRAQEQDAHAAFHEYLSEVDPVVSEEATRAAERGVVHEAQPARRAVSHAGRARFDALPVVQGLIAVLAVEEAADGDPLGMDRVEVQEDKAPANRCASAVIRAHDGLYELKAITHLGGREAEGLLVFNLGTETGTYEAAGFIVHNCGMPVIAFRNGAMSETVKHGETGFVVYTKDEVEELIKSDAVSTIRPERCREWAMQFTVDKMINRWEQLIAEAIEKPW